MKDLRNYIVIVCLYMLTTACSTVSTQPGKGKRAKSVEAIQGASVVFNDEGTAIVNGQPFFPVGIFTYGLNSDIMADIHEQQFNTIIHGFDKEQLNMIEQHGLMAVSYAEGEWFIVAKEHPSLLAWYLTDEPESHGHTPEQIQERYSDLKQRDPHHPIGLCHFLFTALEKFKDGCDFTMTDVYPITKNRDVPIINVGIHMDEARRVHGQNWPNWTYIQVFGGPSTDGGKWAQPLPHEVRCMTYIALIHRANGILYFSYWPQAPRTWESLKGLNMELHRLAPWLVAEGDELAITADVSEVQARARRVGKSGFVMAVNTCARFVQTNIEFDMDTDAQATEIRSAHEILIEKGNICLRLAPFEAKAFIWGEEPSVNLKSYSKQEAR